MGYCMDQREQEFFIPVGSLSDTVAAIQALHGSESIGDSSGKHFSWVEQDFHKHSDPARIFNAWRWNVEMDDDGNIDTIYFDGEKLGDDNTLFNAIAPFVREGSYIEMQGEDGSMWRWTFDGKAMTEKNANITY